MAQIDRSAVRTPMNFIAIAVVLVVLRIGIQAASANAKEEAHPTAWKTARDVDRDVLPGAEDLKENADAEAAPRKTSAALKPISVVENLPMSDRDKKDIADGKLVLYEFVSEWSEPCRSMDANALSNRNVSGLIASKFVPIRVADQIREKGKNPKWIQNLQKRYHVFALPTLVVVDREGEQKAALIGNCSSLTVERFLNRVRS